MKPEELSRLSIGITYRFDLKRALASQAGALIGLAIALISEHHFPFGDEPFRLFSPATLMFLANIVVFIFTTLLAGSGELKLYPSMLIYSSRNKQIRIEFSRIVRVESPDQKLYKFYVIDYSGKETLALTIKNISTYNHARELSRFLRYLLHSKLVIGQFILDDRRKRKTFTFGN